MRPGFGPPAEPASQLTRITAARRPQRVDSHAASGVPRRLRDVGPGRTA
jgi:hypothetical protein